MRILGITLLVLSWPGRLLFAADGSGHQTMADSALAVVLRECKAIESADGWCLTPSNTCVRKRLWNGKTFGEISSSGPENDIAYSRFQERGRTILEQLQSLDSSRLSEILRTLPGTDPANPDIPLQASSQLPGIPLSDKNVIVNYTVYHLAALQCARRAGERNSTQWLELALTYEAIAGGYLLDAFSSGHLLVRLSDPFAFLHPRNSKEAHDYYSNEGVYVMNSRGDVWLTFGDQLFEWFEPTFRHSFAALTSSLRELFLVDYVYAGSRDIPECLSKFIDTGGKNMTLPSAVRRWTATHDLKDYYELLQMPTLLLLPMPISATWSIRARDPDSLHERDHYPQIRKSERDPGFRDPDDEGIDEKFLYPMAAFPAWLLPERWIPADSLHGFRLSELSEGRRDTLAENLIRNDKTIASVRFQQERDIPPSYWGLLLTCSGGYLWSQGSSSGIAHLGLGYAPAIALLADVPLIDRLSVGAAYSSFLDQSSRSLVSVSGGLSIGTTFKPYRLGSGKPFRYVDYVRIEGGYVSGVGGGLDSDGGLLSLGLESATIPFGFTYAGLTLRPKFTWMFLEETMRSVSVEFVVQ